MTAALHYAWLVVRLNFRNRMALVYGYLFPLVFLLAFAVIYRNDPEPLTARLGALLTVTALGGACFGLPTAIVAERERGVWRRYRASPRGQAVFVFGQVASRLFHLVTAGTLQFGVAVVLFGMPFPPFPGSLLTAFLVVSLALISLGLIIAMIANSVPAVQALGQCVFLPLLMIGGIAVPVESLPDWTQALASFFPGQSAVAAIYAAAAQGLASAGCDLVVLVGHGAAAALVAAGLFRWDSASRAIDWRFAAPGLFLWLAVGAAAGSTDREGTARPEGAASYTPGAFIPSATPSHTPALPAQQPAIDDSAPPPPAEEEAVAAVPQAPSIWREVSGQHLERIAFERLPGDAGLVAPIAERGAPRPDLVETQLAAVRSGLRSWPPASQPDPLQRARNLLYVAAVPDLLQMDPLERHLPWLVFDRLRQDIPAPDLPRILYWIAMHPAEGDISAVSELGALGLPQVSGPTDRVRERAMIYALKFLKRLEDQRRSADAD